MSTVQLHVRNDRTAGASPAPGGPDRQPGNSTASSRATVALRSAAASHTGPRPNNQDSGCAGPRLVAVADGVGGNAGGGLASSIAINRLTDQMPYWRQERAEDWLSGAATTANRHIGTAGRRRPGLHRMATTLTALAVGEGGELAVAHIGDSRAYLLRDGRLSQLTTDHTLVQGLLDGGCITPAQARVHPLRSMLLAALHGRDDDQRGIDTSTLRVRPGDRLLVCTDGLSTVVEHDIMKGILGWEQTPAEAVAALLRAVSLGPAQDNATAVVADVIDERPDVAQPLSRVGAAVRLGPVPLGGVVGRSSR